MPAITKHQEHEERRGHDDERRDGEDAPVGLRRHHVFLLDELDAVAEELEPAVEPARVHRTETALHVRHHLQQEDVAEDDGAEGNDGEHDDRLDRQDRPPAHVEREPHHRSMSPRMKYRLPRIVITSGTYTPRSNHGRIDTLLNDAERIFTRNGPVATFEIT